MTSRLFLCLFFIFFTNAIIFTNGCSAPAHAGKANADNRWARHAIAISFDLDKSLVIGTSKIILPANHPLQIDCGPLTLTGAILERKDQTPVQLNLGKKCKIVIAKSPQLQTLHLSWTMKATNPYTSNNLIGKNGITLAGFWHPIADTDMLFELSARLPEGFSAISEGKSDRSTGNKQSYHARVPHPLQSLHFAAGPYRVHSRKLGKVTIYSYFFREDQNLSPGYLEKAAAYIKRYRQLIGPFPYPHYSIVENRLPTGFGMPGFTLLGQAVVRLPFIKDTSLGHEILHSWFGNSIALADSGGNWCEGLTTYLADQSFAQDKGKGAEYRKNQILRYLSYVHPDTSIPLADFEGAGDGRPMAGMIRAIGYDKGSMVFHMLQQLLGKDIFIQGLKKFYAEKKYQRASWQDIEQIFSQVSGKDLAPFFDQWLQRSDIPQLGISQISVDAKEGRSVTEFHLIQKTKTPYSLRIPIVIQTLSGETRHMITSDQLDRKFSITTDTLPSQIIVDPAYDLMRSLDAQEIPPTWSRFMGADRKTVILPKDKETAAIYQPLVDILKKQGAVVRSASEVNNSELATGSFLFAGPSRLRESLFAGKRNKEPGFTLMVRKNPLNIDQTMALVDSTSADETGAAARKLSHYGKYGFLYFRQGIIREKNVDQTQNGFHRQLISPPAGIPTRAEQNFSEIINTIGKNRVIYVGETHTAYGDHILQLQVLQGLWKQLKTGSRSPVKKIAIGMEMFPRSSQQALDDYISGKIKTEAEFIKKSRYFEVWGFDYRLYRDIIAFCKIHKIPIIGLNLDKKIVSKVFAGGSTDAITEDEKKQVPAARDLDVPGYRERLVDIYSQHAASPHGERKKFSGFLQAQAIWDETMAQSIVDYLKANPKSQMVIIAGGGHVYKDSAIPLRVKRRIPQISQSVLVTDNGRDIGTRTGRKIDYLIFTKPIELTPAPKIGVMLEEKEIAGKKGQVMIIGISPHGKGKKAGLKEGDIILRLDDTPVHDIGDLKIGLLDKKVGDTVTLKIFRKRNLLPDETLVIPVELTGMRMDMMMPPGHPQKK